MGALHTLRGTVARIAPLIGQDSANGDWNNVSKVSPGHRRGLAARNDRVSIRADAGLPAIPLQLRLQRIYPGLSAHCHFWRLMQSACHEALALATARKAKAALLPRTSANLYTEQLPFVFLS